MSALGGSRNTQRGLKQEPWKGGTSLQRHHCVVLVDQRNLRLEALPSVHLLCVQN